MKFRYTFLIIIFLFSVSFSTPIQKAESATQATDLSFQADIYGGTGLETISYNSELSFNSYGGFGTNSHVVRSFLASGDQIAYAVSYNDPNSFTLDVSPIGAESPITTLVVTRTQYPNGIVSQSNPNELVFSWEVNQAPYHVILHKKAMLLENQDLIANYMFQETFSVENLGEPFDLHRLTEYLHIDDISGLRDYDDDGINETLLAINDFSTSGYPVFAKINLRRQSISVEFEDNGRYAQITYRPFYRLILTGSEIEVSKSVYITSLAKNGSGAEAQIAYDAVNLLLVDRPCELPYFSQLDPRWAGVPMPCLSPYNTIGGGGCALTASAMVVSCYGEFTTPDELHAQLGSPCLMDWVQVPRNLQNGIDHYIKLDVDQLGLSDADVLNRIDTALNIDKTPVILGLINPSNDFTHYVLVVSGHGTDVDNYRIHDPGTRCGATINLNEYTDDYNFDWLIIYFPFINCRSLTPLIPECTSKIANAVPVDFGTMNNDTIKPKTDILTTFSAEIQIFTFKDHNMYVSLEASSESGDITNMLIWSDTQPNTNWQAFSSLAYLPKSEFVYAQFMDDKGNVSEIASSTIYPNNPAGLNYQLLLPVIIR